MAIDDIQGSSVNQGTNAPIAKDWMSPRPEDRSNHERRRQDTADADEQQATDEVAK